MIQIRNNVFETNSSSTHSMVIGPISDFEKWERGELYYQEGHSWLGTKSGFITKEEAIKVLETSKYKNELTEKAIDWLTSDKTIPADVEDRDEFIDMILQELSTKDVYEYNYYVDYHDQLESEVTEYVTPGGEKLRILCHYGYDG